MFLESFREAYKEDVFSVLQKMDVDALEGLSDNEVAKRREAVGMNVIPPPPRK